MYELESTIIHIAKSNNLFLNESQLDSIMDICSPFASEKEILELIINTLNGTN